MCDLYTLNFEENSSSKNERFKNKRRSWSDDDLVLMILKEKRRKQRFRVPPVLTSRQQHGEYHSVHTCFRMAVWTRRGHSDGPRAASSCVWATNCISISLNIHTSARFELWGHLLPNAVIWLVRSLDSETSESSSLVQIYTAGELTRSVWRGLYIRPWPPLYCPLWDVSVDVLHSVVADKWKQEKYQPADLNTLGLIPDFLWQSNQIISVILWQ